MRKISKYVYKVKKLNACFKMFLNTFTCMVYDFVIGFLKVTHVWIFKENNSYYKEQNLSELLNKLSYCLKY